MKKVIVLASAVLATLITLCGIINRIMIAYNYDICYVFYLMGLGSFWGLTLVFGGLINLLTLFIALEVLLKFKISELARKPLLFISRLLLLLSGMTLGSTTYKLFIGEDVIRNAITGIMCLPIILTLFTYFIRNKRSADKTQRPAAQDILTALGVPAEEIEQAKQK